ncbi:MAG TPA: hypothetical protein VNX15_01850 [Gemmatimonadales bacterium]|jgi:hypothetical protein|nr:hypothetical protein [Gemmatimonadales bacterium]
MIPLLVALALPQVPDSGILVIRQDSTLVARESFHTGVDPTGGGWILDANVRYDRGRPVVQLVPIVQVGSDTSVVKVQFDAGDPSAPMHILGQVGRRRFTLRYISRTQERARELPDPGHSAVVDDSVFSLFAAVAWLARGGDGSISAIFPRAGLAETWAVRVQPLASTTLNGAPAQLRLITAEGARLGTVRIWMDTAGRLAKVEIPRLHLTAERQTGR